MNVVWNRGEVTVGQVWRELAASRSVARNTVQTTIARLEEKGWLRHRVDGSAFLYSAVVPRKITLHRMVGRLVDSAFGGSTENLVMALLEDRALSEGEAERIRAMLEDRKRKRR
jgi:predicted transcriptional regulator